VETDGGDCMTSRANAVGKNNSVANNINRYIHSDNKITEQ